MLSGSCLCGGIRIQVTGHHTKVGICHCSLCRKCSGASATAVIAVAYEQVTWLAGEELVAIFERPSGFGTAFCRVCGSPAPDADAKKTICTIPVGLFDDTPELQVGDHIYVGSKASWDVIGDRAPQFPADGPDRPRDQTA